MNGENQNTNSTNVPLESEQRVDEGIIADALPAALRVMGGVSLNEHSNDSNEEIAALKNMLEAHGIDAEVITIGQSGYIIRTGTEAAPIETWSQTKGTILNPRTWPDPKPEAPVVCFDADDTLFAYTETKEPRLENFQTYAHDGLGVNLTLEQATRLMAGSDKFARWSEAGEDMYHIDAHKVALSWMLDRLRNVSQDDLEDKIVKLTDTLKGVQNTADSSSFPPGFYDQELDFDTSIDVSNVFEPVYNPRRYADALRASTTLASNGARCVILTYGEPEFQLEKVLLLRDELIGANNDWPYADIMLTKASKGAFLRDLVGVANSQARIRQDFFSELPHVLALVDDDPKQLDSFAATNLDEKSAVSTNVVTIRSKRSKTKTAERPWPAHENTTDSKPGEFNGELNAFEKINGGILTAILYSLSNEYSKMLRTEAHGADSNLAEQTQTWSQLLDKTLYEQGYWDNVAS